MKSDGYASPDFDPYYRWLGIAPQHQPPNHYRLLGLDAFESDRDVIRAAAERQSTYIQTFKIGPQAAISQRLLTEISQAKLCLLDLGRKAEYDRSLRSASPPQVPPPVADDNAPPIERSAPETGPFFPTRSETDSSFESAPFEPDVGIPPASPRNLNRQNKTSSWGTAWAAILASVIVIAIAIVLFPSPDRSLRQPKSDATRTTRGPQDDQLKPQENVPHDEPKKMPQPSQVPKARPQNAKHPVPSLNDQAAARQAVRIEGDVSANELLGEANKHKHLATQYVLYLMAIDAAISERNSQIALSAVQRIIDQYQVDANALRTDVHRRLRDAMRQAHPPVAPPLKVAPPVAPAPQRIMLPSGKEMDLDDLKAVRRAEIVELFPRDLAMLGKDKGVFPYKRTPNARPEGLFTFDKAKDFDGAALALHPNGQIKYVLLYEKNLRSGVLRMFSETGELLLRSEYRRNEKFGLTCLVQNGRPLLIEESIGPGKAKSYLVEFKNGEAQPLEASKLNEAQLARWEDAVEMLKGLEKGIADDEGTWKRSYRTWRSRYDHEVDKANAAIKGTKDSKVIESWKKKLKEVTTQFESECREGAQKVLEALQLPSVSLNFNTPIPGTLNDVNGQGTGFTSRLPGTGESIPANDPALNVSSRPGYLQMTATNGNIGGSEGGVNLPNVDAPAVLLEGVRDRDLMIIGKFDDVDVPDYQFAIYIAVQPKLSIRVGFHGPHQYYLAANDGTGGDFGWSSGPNAYVAGDDIILTIRRTSGLWTVSWENLTHPPMNGSSTTSGTGTGSTPFPLLNAQQDLYVGVIESATVPHVGSIDYLSISAFPN